MIIHTPLISTLHSTFLSNLISNFPLKNYLVIKSIKKNMIIRIFFDNLFEGFILSNLKLSIQFINKNVFSISKVSYTILNCYDTIDGVFPFIFNALRKINCIKKTFYIFCRKTVFKTSNFFTFYAQCNTHMEKMTFFSFNWVYKTCFRHFLFQSNFKG